MSNLGQEGGVPLLVGHRSFSRMLNMSLGNDAHCRPEIVKVSDQVQFREKTDTLCVVAVFRLEVRWWSSCFVVFLIRLCNWLLLVDCYLGLCSCFLLHMLDIIGRWICDKCVYS